MIEHGRIVAELVADGTREKLDTSVMLSYALARAIEIIGEAASRMSPAGRRELDLPWAKIIGMRNRLVHAYADIDLDILWRAAMQEVPVLVQAIEAFQRAR